MHPHSKHIQETSQETVECLLLRTPCLWQVVDLFSQLPVKSHLSFPNLFSNELHRYRAPSHFCLLPIYTAGTVYKQQCLFKAHGTDVNSQRRLHLAELNTYSDGAIIIRGGVLVWRNVCTRLVRQKCADFSPSDFFFFSWISHIPYLYCTVSLSVCSLYLAHVQTDHTDPRWRTLLSHRFLICSAI